MMMMIMMMIMMILMAMMMMMMMILMAMMIMLVMMNYIFHVVAKILDMANIHAMNGLTLLCFNQFKLFTPEDYVPVFKRKGISLVVRLNKKQYDRRVSRRHTSRLHHSHRSKIKN